MKNGTIFGWSAVFALALMTTLTTSVQAVQPTADTGIWSTLASELASTSKLQEANSLAVINSQDDEGSPSDRRRNGEGGEDSGTEENGAGENGAGGSEASESGDPSNGTSDSESAGTGSCGNECSKCEPCRQRTKRCRKRSGILSRFRCR